MVFDSYSVIKTFHFCLRADTSVTIRFNVVTVNLHPGNRNQSYNKLNLNFH